MTEIQKKICRELLDQSYNGGFGSYYPLELIAYMFDIQEHLYDNNTNTGILWSLGQHGEGYLHFASFGVSVNIDTREELERYCNYKR